MKFSQYLEESPVEVVISGDSSFISEQELRESLNTRLNTILGENVSFPEQGIQRVRNLLLSYELDFPALYDMDPEGDELVIRLENTGILPESNELPNYLYLIYYLTEDNETYDFYAEIIPGEKLNELTSPEEDTIEN